MTTFLERINAVPIENENIDMQFHFWLVNLVDTMNESLDILERNINVYNNGLIAPSFTTTEITTLAVSAANGTMWYDTDTNQLKAKVNGAVVVIV